MAAVTAATLFGGFAALVGLAATLYGLYLLFATYSRARTATETVDATVRESAISLTDIGEGSDPPTGQANRYVFEVTYEYTYGGRTYTSDRVYEAAAPSTVAGEDDAERRRRERFPPGETVTAHVDPEDPTRSFLIDQSTPGNLLSGVVLVLAGLVFLVGGTAAILV